MASENNKNKKQLVEELKMLRKRIAELESSIPGSKELSQDVKEDSERQPAAADKGFSTYNSLAYFRDLVEGSIVMVQNVGLDGKFLFVNQTWRRVLGYTEADIGTLSFYDIIHPDFKGHCTTLFDQIITGKSVRNIEAVFLTKDGKEVILEGNCGPHRLDGKVMGVLGFFQDITPRKEVENALRESERRLELALESAGLGLWDHNLKTGEVIRDKRWAEMLGYKLEDVDSAARAWKSMIHPDDLPLVDKIAKEHEEGRIPFFKVEHRLRSKTGEWKWILNWGKIVERDEEGQPVRATGTHLDITELKQKEEERIKLEEMIQQAQKAESLSVMAGSIAHNFNNLLMVVLGNLEMSLDCLSGETPLKRHVKNAEKAAKHAADLSTSMLTYVGQARVDVQVINPAEIVEGMREVLELALSKKALLQLNPPPAPVFFKGDSAQIRQVIMNLVTNAAEAVGNAEGMVTLSIGTVYCDSTCFRHPFIYEGLAEGDYVYIDVSDTGPGMDRKTLSRVFDPFFTTKFQGRGLGMAVVLGIVRSHNGAVNIDSEPGRGTTVRVMFSAFEPGEEPQEELVEEKEEWHGRGTVLLVDDETDVLEVAEALLERLGFSVLTAGNGVEAKEVFREKHHEIDCVLLDLIMPQMDGVEAFRELLDIKQSARVIISSGYTEEKSAGLFEAERPAGFIKKPYNLERLKKMLQKVMRNPEQ